jgi:hypothetical protein
MSTRAYNVRTTELERRLAAARAYEADLRAFYAGLLELQRLAER